MPLPMLNDDCLSWFKHCNAECCRIYMVTLPVGTDMSVLNKGSTLSLKKTVTSDMAWYYKLHGANYGHGLLKIPLDDFSIKDNVISIHRACRALLPDGKCSYHGTGAQPKICRYPDVSKGVNDQPRNIKVTPNCLCNHR